MSKAPVPFPFNAQQLAYLREVSRCGTLTAAAEALDVSQPALSQALAELERRLGVPLFERAGRRRVFTEPGARVAQFAEDVLGHAAELRAWLEAYSDGDSGTLTVGMVDAASLYVLPGAIEAFRERCPSVQLRLLVESSEVLLEQLRHFELDLAFVIAPVGAEFESVPVRSEPLHIYSPPGARGAPPADADWALYRPGHTRTLIDEGLRWRGVTPNVVLESGNPEILRQVVALGLAWTVLPVEVAERGAPSLSAQRYEAIAERTLLGVRRAGSPPDARADAFLELALRPAPMAAVG
jgi:DNA-binding transcriptional LysR family regulator